MERLVNFAQKITLKNYSMGTHVDNITRRVVLHQALVIDRDVFKKSEVERKELKRLKRANKKSTSQEREEFLGYFIKAKMPNWNLTFIITQ